MPRHLISDAHEWINEIPTVPIYSPLWVHLVVVGGPSTPKGSPEGEANAPVP